MLSRRVVTLALRRSTHRLLYKQPMPKLCRFCSQPHVQLHLSNHSLQEEVPLKSTSEPSINEHTDVEKRRNEPQTDETTSTVENMSTVIQPDKDPVLGTSHFDSSFPGEKNDVSKSDDAGFAMHEGTKQNSSTFNLADSVKEELVQVSTINQSSPSKQKELDSPLNSTTSYSCVPLTTDKDLDFTKSHTDVSLEQEIDQTHNKIHQSFLEHEKNDLNSNASPSSFPIQGLSDSASNTSRTDAPIFNLQNNKSLDSGTCSSGIPFQKERCQPISDSNSFVSTQVEKDEETSAHHSAVQMQHKEDEVSRASQSDILIPDIEGNNSVSDTINSVNIIDTEKDTISTSHHPVEENLDTSVCQADMPKDKETVSNNSNKSVAYTLEKENTVSSTNPSAISIQDDSNKICSTNESVAAMQKEKKLHRIVFPVGVYEVYQKLAEKKDQRKMRFERISNKARRYTGTVEDISTIEEVMKDLHVIRVNWNKPQDPSRDIICEKLKENVCLSSVVLKSKDITIYGTKDDSYKAYEHVSKVLSENGLKCQRKVYKKFVIKKDAVTEDEPVATSKANLINKLKGAVPTIEKEQNILSDHPSPGSIPNLSQRPKESISQTVEEKPSKEIQNMESNMPVIGDKYSLSKSLKQFESQGLKDETNREAQRETSIEETHDLKIGSPVIGNKCSLNENLEQSEHQGVKEEKSREAQKETRIETQDGSVKSFLSANQTVMTVPEKKKPEMTVEQSKKSRPRLGSKLSLIKILKQPKVEVTTVPIREENQALLKEDPIPDSPGKVSLLFETQEQHKEVRNSRAKVTRLSQSFGQQNVVQRIEKPTKDNPEKGSLSKEYFQIPNLLRFMLFDEQKMKIEEQTGVQLRYRTVDDVIELRIEGKPENMSECKRTLQNLCDNTVTVPMGPKAKKIHLAVFDSVGVRQKSLEMTYNVSITYERLSGSLVITGEKSDINNVLEELQRLFTSNNFDIELEQRPTFEGAMFIEKDPEEEKQKRIKEEQLREERKRREEARQMEKEKLEELLRKKAEEEEKKKAALKKPVDIKPRPPVVTIMGHVDHGKTTLLDALRKSNIVSGEFGGITQHIGAFQVQLQSGHRITFLDTPGHAAFSNMRSRGASVTDVVILVVAAEDGIMNQTIESIEHAKKANVPVIVAINKIDHPNANPEKVEYELSNHGLMSEDLGGDVQIIPISALKRQNLDKLQESVIVQSEVLDLKADQTCNVEASVIESKVTVGRGRLVTALIKKGTLKKGDILIAGSSSAKVRTMLNEHGKVIKEAKPGTPVVITGWESLPSAGDLIVEVENEEEAKDILDERERLQKELLAESSISLSEERRRKLQEDYLVFKKQKAELHYKEFRKWFNDTVKSQYSLEEGLQKFPLVLKADVDGSLEVLNDVLETFNSQHIELSIVQSGVGDINDGDLEIAQSTGAKIYGFNVKSCDTLTKKYDVPITVKNVIYELFDNIVQDIRDDLPSVTEHVEIGRGKVLDRFEVKDKVHGQLVVAGCKCTSGIFKIDCQYKILRENEVVYEGELLTMRKFTKDVSSVNEGSECGLGLCENVALQFEDEVICLKRTSKKLELEWDHGLQHGGGVQ